MSFRKSLRLSALVIAFLSLAGCFEDSEERYDVGYSDGYAEGYNTTCEIRATLVEGDWSSEAYSRGYNAGRLAGAEQCRLDRKQ